VPVAAARRRRGKLNKLVTADEYRLVLAGHYRVAGKYFLVRALANTLGAARLGLIAGRKAAPRAVDRNRGKRLAREAFRSAKPKLPAVDIVFQQKNDLRTINNPAIRGELDRLLRDVVKRFSADSSSNPKPA